MVAAYPTYSTQVVYVQAFLLHVYWCFSSRYTHVPMQNTCSTCKLLTTPPAGPDRIACDPVKLHQTQKVHTTNTLMYTHV